MKNKNAKQNKHSHPGRPRRQVTIPKAKVFSFSDIQDANGCNSNPQSKTYGKALTKDGCTTLCLRNFLKRDNARKGKSLIVKVKGVTAEPNSKSGLGRRKDLYCRRVDKDSISNSTPKAPRKSRTPKSTGCSTTDYEAMKEAICNPSPVTTPEAPVASLVVNVATITPEATPAPVIAPVVENPTPVAAPETAPVVAAPVPAEIAPVAS